jgi:dTDP-4-dehydrorhamnose 3,5-epimerase
VAVAQLVEPRVVVPVVEGSSPSGHPSRAGPGPRSAARVQRHELIPGRYDLGHFLEACLLKFAETRLSGAFLIDVERRFDERGYFARTWCEDEFREAGLGTEIAQCSVAVNSRRGTVRGMHYQAPPYEEAKLVRCSRGAVYDVIIDLRPALPTYTQWLGVELSEENGRLLYVPEGMAHGYQSLVDETEVVYQISAPYSPAAARGVRWNDPLFAIEWPQTDAVLLSERDRAWPDYAPVAA